MYLKKVKEAVFVVDLKILCIFPMDSNTQILFRSFIFLNYVSFHIFIIYFIKSTSNYFQLVLIFNKPICFMVNLDSCS